MNNFLTFHAEATPDGVNIMHRSNNGMTERVETVSYIDAVNRLDAGDYDDKPDEGMFIHLAIASGGNQGYFDYTSQHHVIMWRWLIATALINEMRKENGTVSIIDDSGNHSVVSVYSNGIVAMPLYPVAERLAMANNIEGAMIRNMVLMSEQRMPSFFTATCSMSNREHSLRLGEKCLPIFTTALLPN